MRVVTFHSYKGGRGRTTAIASLANLCFRLGRHVVLLDADVTAPWLHTRYDVPDADLARRACLRELLSELASIPRSIIPNWNLDSYLLPIRTPEAAGSIRLLAPGNPHTSDYWLWVANELPRFFGLRKEPPILELWRDFRALIAHSEPAPDVLLVDAPAGYHQASAYVAMGLADTAVVFAGTDQADSQWTTEFSRMLLESRTEDLRQRYGALRMVGVRARYPTYFHTYEEEATEEMRQFEKDLGSTTFEALVTLESEPRLELRVPSLPIPVTGIIEETKLVRGYAALLSAALPAEWPTGDDPLTALPEDDLVGGDQPRFFWLRSHGVLTNPADDRPNVSFRVETFCGLLDDLHKEIVPIGGTAETTTVGSAALSNAGQASGEKFGESIRGLLRAGLSDTAKLNKWCEFDSRVGFGQLGVVQTGKDEMGRVTDGEIRLDSNFLALGRGVDTVAKVDLCPLMSGYIKGVLSSLLGCPKHSVRVEHPRDCCMRFSPHRSACVFRFECKRTDIEK